MSLLDKAIDRIGRISRDRRDRRAARRERAETDVAPDARVAGARDGHGGDGEYVGRTNPQFDAETQQSGAEARSDAARRPSGDPSS